MTVGGVDVTTIDEAFAVPVGDALPPVDMSPARRVAVENRQEVRALRTLFADARERFAQVNGPGREKACVLTKLDEADMWADKVESALTEAIAFMSDGQG